LEQILASASDANGMVQMIYDATATQAKSLNEVNQVFATLNQSTHANSAIVEQMNAMSKSMSEGSSHLAENMTTFKFDHPSAA
jgi:methyl-accepting chemotaxis protein